MAASTVSEKLLIKAGNRVAVVAVPGDYEEIVGELPEGITLSEDTTATFDVVHGFFTSRETLDAKLDALRHAAGDRGILWISYPKRTSGIETDLSRETLRSFLAKKGLRAVSLISVDDTWSAMRFSPSP